MNELVQQIEAAIKDDQDLNKLSYPYEGAFLHRAAQEGNQEAVDLLLKNKALLEVKDRMDRTPLYWAAQKGHTKVALDLIKAGAQPDLRDNDGHTPLHFAALKDQTEIAKLLIEKGAQVNVQNSSSETPLHSATRSGYTEIALDLIKAGTQVNAQNSSSETPLYLAVRSGYTEIALALIKAGVHLNFRDTYTKTLHYHHGQTPLHLAAISGYTEIALALIKAGAQPDLQNNYGQTPLYLATSRGDTEIALALIKAGAQPNLQDDNGKTPLYWAVLLDQTEIALALIKVGAQPDLQDNQGQHVPLHWAACNDNTVIVKALIKAGAQPDLQDDNGETPLFMAADNQRIEAARLIIESMVIKKMVKPSFLNEQRFPELSHHWNECDNEVKEFKKEVIAAVSKSNEKVTLSDLTSCEKTALNCLRNDEHRAFEKYMSESAGYHRQKFPMHYEQIQKAYSKAFYGKYARRALAGSEHPALHPYEVQEHIIGSLDSKELSNLALAYLAESSDKKARSLESASFDETPSVSSLTNQPKGRTKSKERREKM